MNTNNVLISVPEEELIVTLYSYYCVKHGFINYTVSATNLSVKAFSDYILEYLKDRYNLEDDVEDNFLDGLGYNGLAN